MLDFLYDIIILYKMPRKTEKKGEKRRKTGQTKRRGEKQRRSRRVRYGGIIRRGERNRDMRGHPNEPMKWF